FTYLFYFLLFSYLPHRVLLSFPTRRSSDLDAYTFENEYFDGQQIIYEFSQWMEGIPQVDYGLNTYGIEDILAAEVQNFLNGKSLDRKSTRLNSSHVKSSYAVFCLKNKIE